MITEPEHTAGEDEASRAFEALRADVLALRAIVEPLSTEWQKRMPADYSASLGQITKDLSETRRLLTQINKHPALAMSPTTYQQIVSDSGRVVMRDAVDRLRQAAQWVEHTRHTVETITGSERRREQQYKLLLGTAAAALLIGLLASPFMARVLPLGSQSQVAAAVMGIDRWAAGSALMELENPRAWQEILVAATVLQRNREAIRVCQFAAEKSERTQRCTVIIPPVGTP